MITDAEWNSVRAVAESVAREISGRRSDYFVTGKVIKRDEKNKLVWLKEFGDQPIPLVGFDYDVSYYDSVTRLAGQQVQEVYSQARTTIAKPRVPKIGEYVLVARELGIGRLPRCLGVVQGKNWIITQEDDF